ncbi:lanC-like protein 3 [Anabrus simplex]|uniref:lanC-like protein 3 n=1 Tax=Anabrus simplex TaxID=316456 RepID=UPI0035A31D9E
MVLRLLFMRVNLVFVPLLQSVANIGNITLKKPDRMSRPKRYFINTLKDYHNEDFGVQADQWKMRVFQTVNTIADRQPPTVRDSEGGLYVGIGGIGYMFYYISQSPLFKDEKGEFLKQSLNYMKSALTYAENLKGDRSQASAFLLGNAGIYAVAAVAYHAAGDTQKSDRYLRTFIDAAAICKPVNFLRCGGDEFLVGRAGYLAGALWLKKIFGKGVVPENDIHDICNSIIQSGRTYSQRYRSPCPLMFAYYEVEYLGAAHGLCSILQMLMSFPNFIHSDPSIENDVKASVDFLLKLQTRNGNFPCAMDEVGSRSRPETDELVHWCHGAPGVVYLMAKAYLLWNDQKYLKSCLKCGELVWEKGLLKKGPGICHGVAGNGYVFLLLYRLTQDQKHLYRALQFADFMNTPEFKQGARTPDSPFSLYEGLAGTVCYLADVYKPEEAAFPFLDVF